MTPRTEAGRAAMPWLAGSFFTGDPAQATERAGSTVVVIEAEAVAAYRADLIEKVRGLRPADDNDPDYAVPLAAVLALLEAEPLDPEGAPKP